MCGIFYLDEDDFVVLLSLTSDYGSLWAEFFWFWWGYVDVDVLLDCGAASETASKAASKSTTGSTSETFEKNCTF